MASLHKRNLLVSIFLILAMLATLAWGVKTSDILEKRSVAPAEYNQNEEQEYRDNTQLQIQELKKRIETLENGG